MATHIEQAINALENDVSSLMNGKGADREIAKKKCAFDDIKNASTVIPISMSAKKGEISPVTAADYEIDEGYASSRPVDFTEAWVEKLALSDADIDRWIKDLRDAREANPYDETEPPAEPEFDDDELFEPELIAPPCMVAVEQQSPEFAEEKASGLYDSGISALNMSVFELEYSDEDDF